MVDIIIKQMTLFEMMDTLKVAFLVATGSYLINSRVLYNQLRGTNDISLCRAATGFVVVELERIFNNCFTKFP